MILLGLLPAGAEAPVDGDLEGVQRGLPAVGPADPPAPGGVQGHRGQVQALEGGLLGGEVPAGVDRAVVAGVQGLDRVRGADDGADLAVEGQEREELGPGVLPQPGDRGVFAPERGLGELEEPLQGLAFRRCGVDRLEYLRDRGPVGLGGVAETVPEQVNVMPRSA